MASILPTEMQGLLHCLFFASGLQTFFILPRILDWSLTFLLPLLCTVPGHLSPPDCAVSPAFCRLLQNAGTGDMA